MVTRPAETQIDSDDEELFDIIKARFSCAICLCILKDATMTPCGHLFCAECLKKWVSTIFPEIQCPKCRSRFRMENAILAFDGTLRKTLQSSQGNKSAQMPNKLPHGTRQGQIFLYEQDFTETPSLRSILILMALFVFSWELVLLLLGL